MPTSTCSGWTARITGLIPASDVAHYPFRYWIKDLAGTESGWVGSVPFTDTVTIANNQTVGIQVPANWNSSQAVAKIEIFNSFGVKITGGATLYWSSGVMWKKWKWHAGFGIDCTYSLEGIASGSNFNMPENPPPY